MVYKQVCYYVVYEFHAVCRGNYDVDYSYVWAFQYILFNIRHCMLKKSTCYESAFNVPGVCAINHLLHIQS